MTETYARNKATILVKDHNSYRKMKYAAACNDYRTALDNLIHVAARQGIKISYTVSKDGYLTLC